MKNGMEGPNRDTRFKGEEIYAEAKRAQKEAGVAVHRTVNALRAELGIDVEVAEETPQMTTVRFVDSEGRERRFGMMKMSGADQRVEARVRFPELDADSAAEKVKELRAERKERDRNKTGG